MPISLVSQCLALMAAMAALLVRQLQVATDWIDALIRKEPIETDESKVLRQWYCRTCRARVVGLRCPVCYHTPRNPKNGEAYGEDLEEMEKKLEEMAADEQKLEDRAQEKAALDKEIADLLSEKAYLQSRVTPVMEATFEKDRATKIKAKAKSVIGRARATLIDPMSASIDPPGQTSRGVWNCPVCKADMILKFVGRGKFWGCTQFALTNCDGTRNGSDPEKTQEGPRNRARRETKEYIANTLLADP